MSFSCRRFFAIPVSYTHLDVYKRQDVIFQMIGDELGHVLGQIEVEKLRLALDDGHAGLEIRRLDIGGQAPLCLLYTSSLRTSMTMRIPLRLVSSFRSLMPLSLIHISSGCGRVPDP